MIDTKKIICVFVTVLLSACGGISQITPETALDIESKLPQIHPDGGQLCVFRVSNFLGAGLAHKIYANGEYIGRLPNSSYFCVNLEPMEYIISTGGTWQRAGTEVVINQGQRKFIELSTASGLRLDSVMRDVGLAGIADTM